jgi:hypothetical protein
MNSLEYQSEQMGLNINVSNLFRALETPAVQKFCILPLAEYFPISVSEGGGEWVPQIVKYTIQYTGDDNSFDSGLINLGSEYSRLSQTNISYGAESFNTVAWAKQDTYSIPELQYATRHGAFDFVVEKEKARHTSWLLGFQELSLFGSVKTGLKGLLNIGKFIDTSTIPTGHGISDLDPEEFQAFVATAVSKYMDQVEWTTSYPNRFVMPAKDYTGLASASSPTFPINTKLEYMLNAFKQQTGMDDFKILGCPYAMASRSFGNLTKDRYALYRHDPDTMAVHIPVNYTSTNYMSCNGFGFSSVGYALTSGFCLFRGQEILYFQAGA